MHSDLLRPCLIRAEAASFPDKVHGYFAKSNQIESGYEITFKCCQAQGSAFDTVFQFSAEPFVDVLNLLHSTNIIDAQDLEGQSMTIGVGRNMRLSEINAIDAIHLMSVENVEQISAALSKSDRPPVVFNVSPELKCGRGDVHILLCKRVKFRIATNFALRGLSSSDAVRTSNW